MKSANSQQRKTSAAKLTKLRCSSCKAPGHNKRTCGKAKNAKKQKPLKPPRGYIKPGTPFHSASRRGGGFTQAVNKSLGSTTGNVTSSTQDAMSPEEIMVWWELVKPKEEREYLPALQKFLHNMSANLTPEISEKLRNEIIEDAPRSYIANFIRDTETPFRFAKFLAHKYDLQEELVHHQSKEMPVSFLKKMINHESHIVRCAVARHPNTTQAMLVELFDDKHARVRRTVVKNFRTPNHLVQKALKDRSKEVALVAGEKIAVRKKVGML